MTFYNEKINCEQLKYVVREYSIFTSKRSGKKIVLGITK